MIVTVNLGIVTGNHGIVTVNLGIVIVNCDCEPWNTRGGERKERRCDNDRLTPRDKRGKGEREKSSYWSTSPL